MLHPMDPGRMKGNLLSILLHVLTTRTITILPPPLPNPDVCKVLHNLIVEEVDLPHFSLKIELQFPRSLAWSLTCL